MSRQIENPNHPRLLAVRCQSASPGLGWRCEKRAGHGEKSGRFIKRTHRAEYVTWGPDEGSLWTGTQQNLASGTGAGVPVALDPDAMGLNLLASLKTNFERMDQTERATDPRRIELAQWWRDTAEAEIEQTVDKAIEYGATDLVDIGRSLARVADREIDDSQAAEWGIFFYLEGKLSRWRSAIERGGVPSFDTLLDIGVYARMAQRVRTAGSWPGVAR